MLIGTKVTIGPFIPDDYAAMYCWANDVVAARFDGTFRPANLSEVVHQCESVGKDPSRVMFAIRKRRNRHHRLSAHSEHQQRTPLRRPRHPNRQ